MGTLASAGITDVGKKRKTNEDSYLVSDDLCLYFVADGMGGHRAGEIASSTAIETIVDFANTYDTNKDDLSQAFGVDLEIKDDRDFLLTAIKLANHSIFLLAKTKNEYEGMGTTISGARISDAKATIANVGDSRAYLVRNNEITQITTDHSWVSEQVKLQNITKAEARNHKWKNMITRALGNKLFIEVDIHTVDLCEDDILLFCTDGLSGMLDDDALLEILANHKSDLGESCKQLIAAANDNGGTDNITLVLSRYNAE